MVTCLSLLLSRGAVSRRQWPRMPQRMTRMTTTSTTTTMAATPTTTMPTIAAALGKEDDPGGGEGEEDPGGREGGEEVEVGEMEWGGVGGVGEGAGREKLGV